MKALRRELICRFQTRYVSSQVGKCGQTKRGSSYTSLGFWSSRDIWSRSAINTFRCLIGCTSGDFSMMWWLQSTQPQLDIATTMGLSMAAGISTSILLETVLLHLGRDQLPWKHSFRTATGMSMISMIAMEVSENVVDYSLTGGTVDFGSTYFWISAGLATTAGFIVPLPYNYFRLKAFKKSCH